MTAPDANISGSGIIANMTDEEAEAQLELELRVLSRGIGSMLGEVGKV